MEHFVLLSQRKRSIEMFLICVHPKHQGQMASHIFYIINKLWHVIGKDITAGVLAILNDQKDPSDWNATLITFIPKVKEPLSLKDFRPISLCNTCYKIVSRTITNRFRPILNRIIDSFQRTFIPDRLILDNVIVGFECMHWIWNNRKAKTGYAELKLDMNKAYNIVKWNFLKEIMLKLGFAEAWVNLIMRATREDCLQVRHRIKLYEKASGQLVNFDKSTLMFSSNTSPRNKADIAELLSVSVVNGHDIYLRLPTFSLCNKRLQFTYLHERVEQKIKGWTSTFVSMGGCEILIKAFLQAVSFYAMSCFKLSVSLYQSMEQAYANFWWNDTQGKRGYLVKMGESV